MTVKFKGAAKRIESIDIPRVGKMIGVGEDEIRAVMEVEAAGSGFDKQGRVKTLFEPHLFYRELKGSQRDIAVRSGLAYPNWKRDYPADSYPRIEEAMAINETAALRSCSWGLGQILGSNCKLAGYPTPQAMVAAFADDEDNHLEAMVAFIKAAKLDDELRAHNWAGFARGYNGPQYAKNKYDTKLAASYRKWAKIPDTPWSEDAGAPVVPHGQENRSILYVQTSLDRFGYHEVGNIDGKWGSKTAGAIAAFMNDRRMEGQPTITDALYEEIDFCVTANWSRPIAEARATATIKEVVKAAPEAAPVRKSKLASVWAAIGSGASAVFAGISGNIGEGISWVANVRSSFDDVPGWVWFAVACAIAGGVAFFAQRGESKIVDAFRTGERN